MNRSVVLSALLLGGCAASPDATEAGDAIARGGASGNADTLVCHRGSNLWVSSNAVSGHLRHGDALPDTWYEDLDGDGHGDVGSTVEDCTQPSGYVADGDDCDDGDAGVGAPSAWYFDGDGDGLGDPADSVEACDAPSDYVDNADDLLPGDGDNDGVGDADDLCPTEVPTTDADGDGCEDAIQAGPWDAAADFSRASNPNGDWSYAYATSSDGALSLMGGGAYDSTWWVWGGGWLQFYFNSSATTNGGCHDWCVQPGQLAMHPSNGSADAVLVFTAPVAGTYHIDATFQPIDAQVSHIGVTVALAGSVLWSDALTYPADTAIYSDSLWLGAGETARFGVDNGGNGYFNDGTGIDVQISM